ncbi:integral membrane protein [hydrothermal vent metagenome]|uniref:Integral membrane protein n=1 Tax=hydrothermal vent metagenome TaxID=652676 RepID=A0A1W1C2V5_9ZZZZ
MKPLIVDLDHTLIHTDLLQKSALLLLKKNPFFIFIMPFWLIKGKGYLKDKISQRITIDVSLLPYNQKVIKYIKNQPKEREIVLATASHKYYAKQVFDFLNLFDKLMASDKNFNLSSQNKANKLIEIYGKGNFDYIGDHKRDIPVWLAGEVAIMVNVNKNVKNFIAKTKKIEEI